MSRRSTDTSPESPPRPAWLIVLSSLWIAGFLYVFFDQQLPNNPDFRRTDIWELLLDEILGTQQKATVQLPPPAASGWKFLPQRLPFIRTAALLLLTSWTLGQVIFRSLIRLRNLTRSEQLVIAMGLGLSAQSLIVLLCGLAGLLNPAPILLPGIVAAMVLAVQWQQQRRTTMPLTAAAADVGVTAVSPGSRRRHGWSLLIGITILLPFGCYLLLGAMSPQNDFDVRHYHLQGPKEWFQQGRISFLNHNVYTSFPFLTEMFSLAGMVLDDDWSSGALSGQLVLGTFALLTSTCVYCIATRLAGPTCGLLAAVMHLTTPWTLRISIIAYAEGGLTFYLTASVLSLLLLRDVDDDRQRLRFAVVTGILAGSGMACKYTGLITVVVPAGLLLLFSSLWNPLPLASASQGIAPAAAILPAAGPARDRRRFRMAAAVMIAFGCGTCLAIAPWLARNLYDTGNPVYPLAYSVFGGTEWTPKMDAKWRPAHAPAEHSLTRLPQHLLDFAVRNDWTSGLLCSLSVPGLLLISRIRSAGIVVSMLIWTFATWWALTHRIDRFWIPAIPLLAVVSSLTWKMTDCRFWKTFLIAVVTLGTLFNVRFCMTPLIGFHAGLMDLDAAHDLTVRSDFRLLNDTLPADARVLMVGEAEVFNAEFDVVYNTVFDDSIFEQWTSATGLAAAENTERRMRTAAEISSTLARNNVTHVLVNWTEILRYRNPGSYGYTDYVQPIRFQQLVADGVLNPPVSLLTRPWSTFSPAEQQLINTWPGFESLIDAADVFSSIQLYEVERSGSPTE